MTSHISFKITSACIAVLYKKKFFDFYTYVINIFLFVIVHFPVKIHSLQFVDLFIGQLIYLYLLHLNIDQLNADSLLLDQVYHCKVENIEFESFKYIECCTQKDFWSKALVSHISDRNKIRQISYSSGGKTFYAPLQQNIYS